MQKLTDVAIEQAQKQVKPTLVISLILTLTFISVSILLFILGMIVIPIIFLILGLFFIALFAGTKDNVKKFGKYAWLIFEENITAISGIAQRTGSSIKEVEDVLKQFRYMDVFRGINLDWKDSEPQTPVDCVNCGAANQTNQCEFCGSVIK